MIADLGFQPAHASWPRQRRPCQRTWFAQNKPNTRSFVLIVFSLYRRSMATNPPPEKKAEEIINKLPSSPNLITKTGTALLGTGLAAAAISQELYVVNEETVLLVASAIFFTYVAKVRVFKRFD